MYIEVLVHFDVLVLVFNVHLARYLVLIVLKYFWRVPMTSLTAATRPIQASSATFCRFTKLRSATPST